ncbi:MAG: TolC family protein, partial [Phycisphaerales bacterium]|nr:TolC family protein [Phycisphaerales bacterium]
ARSDLRTARLRLFRLMNAPITGVRDREITPTSDPVATAEDLADIAARVELARRLRPDLNEARLRLDQRRLETIRTRNGLLPRLDLFIALGKTGYADTFVDSFRELDGRTYDVEFGLLASQSLGRQTARGEHEAAIASRQQAAAAIENLAELVELDVHLAVNDAERAREQIGATMTTRELQAETAEAEVQRFDVGASTTLLVAQAQRDLLLAQINEVEAVANFRIALIRLYLAEGSLLERRGIAIDQPGPRGG